MSAFKKFRLTASALLVAFAVILTSCVETTAPVEPQLQTVQADSAQLLELLTSTLKKTLYPACSPLPYASDSKWVGPAGGTINVGPHRLVIPSGALANWTKITAVAPSSTINRVEFYPHGLVFAKPVNLSLSYANCGIVSTLLPRHIAYADDNLKVLELLDAVPNLLRRESTAPIKHFSDYILAW